MKTVEIMSLAPSLRAGSGCDGCRVLIIHSLFSISNRTLARNVQGGSWSSHWRLLAGSRSGTRAFSAKLSAREDADRSSKQSRLEAERNDRRTLRYTEEVEVSTEESQEKRVPWYIAASREEEDSPILQRQRLPDIPPDSPKIVDPLLHHLSVELGIDDIRILDLRKLNPPPALGANLMMLVGTTRSEKHLHVSGDRLRSWGRVNHNLEPVADGLLGKNEIKLRLRRKARRARLLGSVGAKRPRNEDDGLQTGWVCVNLGSVESFPSGSASSSQDDFIGFGEDGTRTRIVVQLLTEEKRAEMDLEGLWLGQLFRSRSREAATEPHQEELARQIVTPEKANEMPSSTISRSPISLPSSTSHRQRAASSQYRGLHTLTAARNSGHVEPVAAITSALTDVSTTSSLFQPLHDAEAIRPEEGRKRIPVHATKAEYNKWLGHHLRSLPLGTGIEKRKARILKADVNSLKALPRDHALTRLGSGDEDFTSTPFLFSFYQTLPTFPLMEHWQWRFELLCHAIRLRHPGYRVRSLLQLIESIEMAVTSIPREVFIKALQVVVQRQNQEISVASDAVGHSSASSEVDLNLVLEIITKMQKWGHDVLCEDVFICLYEAIGLKKYIMGLNRQDAITAMGAPLSANSFNHAYPTGRAQRGIETLMNHFGIYFSTEKSLVLTLTLYAAQGRWNAFWDTWSLPARRLAPRGPILYTSLFRIVARTKPQRECMQILRSWIPAMEREEPPVKLRGGVARAVMTCIKVAEPDVEAEANAAEVARGEWISLWRQCQAGLPPKPAKDLSSHSDE